MPVRIIMCKLHGQIDPKVEARLDYDFYMATRYYNALVVEENRYRQLRMLMMRKFNPEIVKLEAALETVEKKLEAALDACKRDKGARKAAVASADLRKIATACREEVSEAETALREAQRAVYITDRWKTADKKLELWKYKCFTRVYGLSEFAGVWWGTKSANRDDLTRAAKSTPIYEMVKFRKSSRKGKLASQIQKGMTIAQALSCTSTKFQLQYPYVADKRELGLARIRLASDAKRRPIWTELKVRVDRTADELPPDAIINWASIVRREGYSVWQGGQFRNYDFWSVQLTVKFPAETRHSLPGVVAVDVGWRKFEDGRLRVGCWVDDSGESGELYLPPDLLQLWTDAKEVMSKRRLSLNSQIEKMRDWCKNNSTCEEIVQLAIRLSHAKSISVLIDLLDRWDLFPMDVMCDLIEWHVQDTSREATIRRLIHKAENKRLELFRQFACKLGKTYGTIVIEKVNLAKMRRDPEPDDDVDEYVVRFWRNIASPGLLLQCLATQRWCKVVKKKCSYTTVVCRDCSVEQKWDKKELIYTCTNCGSTWDQDENAARNLLKMHQDNIDSLGDDDDDDGTPKADGEGTKPKKKTLKLPRRKPKPKE